MLGRTIVSGTFIFCVIECFVFEASPSSTSNKLPLVLTTWPYQDAVTAGERKI
jgi:hypothetical protein